MSHTPGPWKVKQDIAPNADMLWIVDREDRVIAALSTALRLDYATEPANARLIAAAPTILTTLYGVKSCQKHRTDDGRIWIPDKIMSTVHQAIAHAEGRTDG